MITDKPINLLWTGGLDSSFRLLELLLIQRKTVQPYYVFDRVRKSTSLEVQAMEKIKCLIFARDAQAAELLKPTIFRESLEIKPNESITKTYQRVYNEFSIGIQNEWLARLAEEENINDLELSIESRVNFTHPFNKIVLDNLVTEADGLFLNYKLQDNPTYSDLSLFKNFRLPLIKRTKMQMLETAKKHNFLDILEYTWFCHTPSNQKPCGTCKPCSIAIGEGLWKRVPIYGLIRYFDMHSLRPFIKRNLFRDKKAQSIPLRKIFNL